MKKITFIGFLILTGFLTQSQVVSTDPALPTADAAVTITFNANGTGLEGYTGDVYAHTGLTVNGNKWQYVIADWNTNIDKAKLTNIGVDLYEFEINPTIRSFYGASPNDEITEICLVFRSEDGSQQTMPDIFIDVFEIELNVILITPDATPYFVDPGELIEINAEASLADSIYLYIDDQLITSDSGNTINVSVNADMTEDSKHWIKVVAKDDINMAADSTYYYVRGATEIADLPMGVVDGINYVDDQTVTLVLNAPYKNSIFVYGDFSNWQIDPILKMKRNVENVQSLNTRYWVTISGLNPGEEYAFQYLVDEEIMVTDPYSEKILDPWNDKYIPNETYPNLKPYPEGKTEGLVSVLRTNEDQYVWQNTGFNPPERTDLVIYELLIRDFLGKRNYQTLIDTLHYLVNLGVNAIELMPVNEFDGNLSWGYNPNHYFAVDKFYGTKNDLKEFIDVCHGYGIAVILDVVFNHATGISPFVKLYWDDVNNRPASNSPFYNPIPTHDFNVFNDMNHESQATKQYISRAIRFWLEEFRVDGYRFDLSKGFTQKNTLGNPGAMAQYDQSRIDILKQYADTAWSVNPDMYFILEHFADNSEEKVLSNDGMMLWGNSNYNYNEGTMGYNESGKSDFSWISYQKRGWNDPHVVGYMESHDEERLMAKNINYGNSEGSYNVKDTTTALERQQLAAAFFFTIPGPKMIWQFGELGYDYHINYPGVIGDDDHRVDQKPIRWDYLQDYRRKVLYNVYREIINLKKEEPAFKTTDFSLVVNTGMKRIHLNHSSMNVTVLGNFNVTDGEIVPDFQHAGTWYDFFSGDSMHVTNVNEAIMLNAGEYRIYTDKKLVTPQIGLGTYDNSDHRSNVCTIYPNPSDGQFNINAYLSGRSSVEVNIYNLNGQRVKSLFAGTLPGGKFNLEWDALKDGGGKANKGMYLLELTIDGAKEIKKLILH